MLTDLCGSSLLLALPDDIFSTISRFLCPVDVCSLGLSCRDLHSVLASDKVWLSQCDELGLVSCRTLTEWRKGVSSYKSLCRFLVSIQPLLGIWVHQNPELGNVVYVMPGFLSVVGCRIIPQEIGPLGVEGNSILWAPVFEIICSYEGGTSFILHGRERGGDYVYPGLLKTVDRTCNVLLLEVEPHHEKDGGKLAHSKSFAHQVETEIHQRLSRSQIGISNSHKVGIQKRAGVSFSRLGFGDRRRLLDVVTSQVKQRVADETNMILFPRLTDNEADSQRDVAILRERRLLLLQMCTKSDVVNDLSSGQEELNVTENNEYTSSSLPKGKTLSGFLKNSLKQILGKSSSTNGTKGHQKNTCSSRDGKSVHLHEFLQSSDTVGLTLRATTMKLSSYRAWPNMHDSRFALYKLPIQTPNSGHDFAGLWGGTFGWPPGRTSDDKPVKALFVILISYEESEGQKLLIATKILEGTNYVLHPNGSAMFIVNTGNPSTDAFPWDNDGESNPVDIKQSFDGEGIANGYGFRYPGSKPGSLFVIEDGLVFVWKESRAVLTLRRLDLPELLKRGERVFALTPISNFAYLTKTYSNVYSGYSNCASGLSSPRRNNV